MATLPASGPISYADIQAVMGGSGPVSLQDYRKSASTRYTRGVPGMADTDMSLTAFQGKGKALLDGLQYRIFRQVYQFAGGGGGAAGTGSFAGGGGAGGVSITHGIYGQGAVTQGPNSSATSASGTMAGAAGTGFGAGGGGTGTIKARYLSFQYGNAYGGFRAMNLGGVRVYSTFGGSNIITSSMTVTASSVLHADWRVGHMVDNNDANGWHNADGEEYPWVKVDLGSEQFIHRVELTNRVDCCRGRIAGITLQLRDNSDTVIFTSGLMANKSGTTLYQNNNDGYLHYTFWPSVNTTPYGSDTIPYSTVPFGAGQGASGFVYMKLGGTEYFTNASTNYTFTSAGTAKLLLMGGGGGGGTNAGANNRGSGGGGAGYLQTYFVSVSNGTVATITVGGPGTPDTNGGTTSVTINSVTYSAAGGGNGSSNQYGGAGSSSGGTGGSAGGVTAGSSSGATQTSTSSQGATAFAAYIKNEGGYFADDPTWFDSRTENYPAGLATDFSSINTGTGGIVPTGDSWELYSVEWFGYFYAPTTGSYTFYTESDDASYLWIGSTALSGYTTANALVNNGSLHGLLERSGSISLTADTYYPIRVQFGENYSGDNCYLSFAGPSISRTYNWSGYAFYGIGNYTSFPSPSARLLKAVYSTNVDKPYFINVNGTATTTYCLMDSKWDGGGWMMMMKATRGTTFQYTSSYWTDSGTTLNPTDTTRTDADAKFAVMNSAPIKDVIALWPDVGSTGGSISQTEAWSWLINDYFYGGTRIPVITGLSSANSRDATTHFLNTSEPSNFAGYSTSIWSAQVPTRRTILGGSTHLTNEFGAPNGRVRFGFVFNENQPNNWTSMDVIGGIGLNLDWGSFVANYSSGDAIFCCQSVTGLNRTMRVEMYGR
jgi:hypothetical protein